LVLARLRSLHGISPAFRDKDVVTFASSLHRSPPTRGGSTIRGLTIRFLFKRKAEALPLGCN
jgi:hypothetical protein